MQQSYQNGKQHIKYKRININDTLINLDLLLNLLFQVIQHFSSYLIY
jgi:hypothetical protein